MKEHRVGRERRMPFLQLGGIFVLFLCSPRPPHPFPHLFCLCIQEMEKEERLQQRGSRGERRDVQSRE